MLRQKKVELDWVFQLVKVMVSLWVPWWHMGSWSIGQAFLSLVLGGMCGQLHTSADWVFQLVKVMVSLWMSLWRMGSWSIGQAFVSLALGGMCGQLHTSADWVFQLVKVVVSLWVPLWHMGSWSIGQAFLSLALGGMCGQLHTSADLHRGKISLNREVGGPKGWLDAFKREMPYALAGNQTVIPWHPACSVVTTKSYPSS